MDIIEKTFPSFSCAIYQQAKNGEHDCGDSFYVKQHGGHFVIAIADGLGSGSQACLASSRAINLLDQFCHLPVTDIVQQVNEQISGTRGVVFAIVKFFPQARRGEFSGIGNIMFTLYPMSGRRIRALSRPGYLDGRDVKPHKEDFSYTPSDHFVMYSDGISPTADWTDALHFARQPTKALQAIKQLWKEQNDDITVIVGR